MSPSKPLRRERLKIPIACQTCRLRKAKCDGGRPACTRCLRRGKACTYSIDSSGVKQQTKRKPPVPKAPAFRSHISVPVSSPNMGAYSLATSSTPAPISNSGHVDDQEPELQDQNRAYYSAHGQFAGEVAAAIDVRAGLAPAATSNLVPFVDAPLFGVLDLDSPRTVPAKVLPPRAHADRLVSIYWQYVNPVELVLSRDRFFRDYEATYSRPGALLHADRDVWLSLLNVVFALAVQRQESTPLQERNEEGSRFFERAWALLPPETILWKPGTIELVQCLMLMNRYLHCTNNQLKTWMTAGLAMRIAQSMCCHLSEGSAKDSCGERQLKQQVWASCVALDRCVSWSLGRTSAPSLNPLPNRADQGGSHAERLTRTLELYEIGNQIQLAQTQTRNALAARLGLPRLYQQDEYHAVAVQLDACLNKWENELPDEWKLQNLKSVADRTSRAELYVLHLRVLHSRIVLYRPMLARLYSMKSHPTTTPTHPNPNPNNNPPSPSLSDRLLKECAAMCLETAQNLTSLIISTLSPTDAIGLLPWWYRIYYLHISGTNFLAAMFETELFTAEVERSWDEVLCALRAHEHLSEFVPQCVRTFEVLAARILETRDPATDGSGEVPLEQASGGLFDHIFQDLGFDCDNFLFGMEDLSEGLR